MFGSEQIRGEDPDDDGKLRTISFCKPENVQFPLLRSPRARMCMLQAFTQHGTRAVYHRGQRGYCPT